MASITLEDLHAFHAIDREIFTRLVINHVRDPGESLLVMTLWLWLEDMNFLSIVSKMSRLSDAMVNALAEEAVSCLMWLQSKTPPPARDGSMALTARTLERSISVQMCYRNKFSMISGIKTFLKNVCVLIFTDILQPVLSGTSQVILNEPLIVPGFPHPTFGAVSIIPRPLDYSLPAGGLWGWSPTTEAPVDDRTMFLNFSRGYLVTEAEVRELFTGYFGDCVDQVRMEPEESSSSEQPLYAQMVVRAVSTIDQILSRGFMAKFRINGKHVWARKYERAPRTT